MSVTSDEINYLIYRYLQESGFHHSAFALNHESLLHKSSINISAVPPGALITLLQKGLQYVEVEWHLTEDGDEVECDEQPSLLSALTPRIEQRKRERKESDKKDKKKIKTEDKNLANENDSTKNQLDGSEILEADVTILEGHSSEVFLCAWNPKKSLLATGSGDSTARIWDIPTTLKSQNPSSSPLTTSIILNHPARDDVKKHITTLDWNGNGNLLATGTFDGVIRIWNEKGVEKGILSKHKGPILALKWSKNSEYLLSASLDKSVIVWEIKNGTGELKQYCDFHTGGILDVDWRDNTSFASCSADKMIHVCQLGEDKPIRSFSGHNNEINVVKWDPTGTLLASCSDDSTAKIWRMDQSECVFNFVEHEKEIYTISWSPTSNILATASFDCRVKLWDSDKGTCIWTFSNHSEAVYAISFSPDGKFLASGAYDQALHIWNVKNGSLVKTYRGDGGIFDIGWNRTGDKIAVCMSSHNISVLDFKV